LDSDDALAQSIDRLTVELTRLREAVERIRDHLELEMADYDEEPEPG
jgi:hypothetical protein